MLVESLTIPVILFLVGFFVLIKGSDLLIKGSVRIARFLGISDWFIGVVIVGIGTSIPEISVTMTSALEGSYVGLGTIIGSIVFNSLFILGLLAVARPFYRHKQWLSRDIPLLAVTALCAGGVLFFPYTGQSEGISISPIEGSILIALFIGWIISMIRRREEQNENDEDRSGASPFVVLMILAGFVGVFLGSTWIVDGASHIARFFGVPDSVIGIVLVGVGTSLSEVVVSLRALQQKRVTIAVGNIIGSNMFLYTFLLGISSLIGKSHIPSYLVPDLIGMVGVSLVVWGVMALSSGRLFGRFQGIIFLVLYGFFFFWVLWR